jgi:hypothetical protein
MSQETQNEQITKKVVVYRIPAMDGVTIRRDVEYRATETDSLTMDIYYPPDFESGARLPAVVFVAGYPDLGFEAMLGCKFKEMGAYISWGQLTAASGMIAITYTNREPIADLYGVFQYLREHAASLGIAENRIGAWACSGNVPLSLSLLMRPDQGFLKCLVLCYGVMLDLDGTNYAAEGARIWGYANSCAGKSMADVSQNIPLFIVRAGQDQMPHLNETIDRFLAGALSHNLPVTFVNHAQAPHAFDLVDDSESSREIIRQILSFMRFHLLEAPAIESGSLSN